MKRNKLNSKKLLFQDLTSQHSSFAPVRSSSRNMIIKCKFLLCPLFWFCLRAFVRAVICIAPPYLIVNGKLVFIKNRLHRPLVGAPRASSTTKMPTFGSMLDEGHPRKWITDPACKHSRAHFDIDATCRVWDDNNIALYGFHGTARADEKSARNN